MLILLNFQKKLNANFFEIKLKKSRNRKSENVFFRRSQLRIN